jgi:hypothetical protein
MKLEQGNWIWIRGEGSTPHVNCKPGDAIEKIEGAPQIEDPATDCRTWVREDGIYRLDGGRWARWLIEDKSFAAVPVSVAEKRAEKAGEADKWSARDALLSVLRDLDAGKMRPETLVVVWVDVGELGDRSRTNYAAAGGPAVKTLGSLVRAMHMMQDGL